MKQRIRYLIGDVNALYIKNIRSKIFATRERRQFQARRRLYSQFLQEGDLFFDVGTNRGDRISPIIDLGIKIVAIEPQDHCVQYLQQHFGDQIHIIHKGLGAVEGEKKLFISNLDTISSFSEDWIKATQKSGRLNHFKWNRTALKSITTLDHLIDEFGVPDFIKIDVEGYELEVLKGLSAPVKMLSFEYTLPEYPDQAIACIHQIQLTSAGPLTFNYSIGESMQWELENWCSGDEMIRMLTSKKESEKGDIYVQNPNFQYLSAQ